VLFDYAAGSPACSDSSSAIARRTSQTGPHVRFIHWYQAAKATPGYLGEESWENPAQGLISNVYYWESLEALQALMRHPAHLQAKARQADWLDGYQVVISQVLRTYGDSRLAGKLPTAGAA